MRAIFKTELKTVRQAVATICTDMDLYTGADPSIWIYGRDGRAIVDYPEAEAIMRVIGLLAETGSLERVE